ncbi:MAG: NAD(P)H-hydrate dehydratase, partial [Candidatus Bipolaricaulia bacterium]
ADGHKGTFGRVLVVAGSIGMTGAAILCCRAALRAGAGLVTLATPRSLNGILEAALPEVITVPLPDEDGHVVNVDDERFAEALERSDVLAIGPGLSRAPKTGVVVRELVSRFAGPTILDADGIVAFGDSVDELRRAGGHLLLTPHPGELSALVGRSPDEIDADRIEVARAFARENGLALLLKGRPTMIGLPNGTVYLNPTGNSGLATGGSGDVLTGLIAGFVAGGASLDDASILGAYVHGWAAEAYVRDRAERSLTPSDVIDLLPSVLREVETWG